MGRGESLPRRAAWAVDARGGQQRHQRRAQADAPAGLLRLAVRARGGDDIRRLRIRQLRALGLRHDPAHRSHQPLGVADLPDERLALLAGRDRQRRDRGLRRVPKRRAPDKPRSDDELRRHEREPVDDLLLHRSGARHERQPLPAQQHRHGDHTSGLEHADLRPCGRHLRRVRLPGRQLRLRGRARGRQQPGQAPAPQVHGQRDRRTDGAERELRLYAFDPSPSGGRFFRTASSSWSESAVTWTSAPAADPSPLAILGAVAAGTWYEVDLSSLVKADGTYSLRVTSTDTNGADYTSKEGTAGFAPRLVVTPQAADTHRPPLPPTSSRRRPPRRASRSPGRPRPTTSRSRATTCSETARSGQAWE